MNVYNLKSFICLILPLGLHNKSRHADMLNSLQERLFSAITWRKKKVFIPEWVGKNRRLVLVSRTSWNRQRLLFSHSHICCCRYWLSNVEHQSEARCDIRCDKRRQTELAVSGGCHCVLPWCWFTAAFVVSTQRARCRLVGLLCQYGQIWRRWHDDLWYRLMFHTHTACQDVGYAKIIKVDVWGLIQGSWVVPLTSVCSWAFKSWCGNNMDATKKTCRILSLRAFKPRVDLCLRFLASPKLLK